METKKCTICKLDLPKTVEYFATRTDKKILTYQSSCRECHKKYRKIHYQNNKQKYIKKAAKYNDSIIIWFQDIKKKLKCFKCGEERWWVLDFHHRDPSKKESSLSILSRKGSKKNILEEIQKCDVLCTNCHRDLHYQEKQASLAQRQSVSLPN